MRPEVHLAKRLSKIFCLKLVSWEQRIIKWRHLQDLPFAKVEVGDEIDLLIGLKCSFFTAEQEGRSVVPHVECYPLLRDWLLSGACHGAGYMLVLHVVLVHSR